MSEQNEIQKLLKRKNRFSKENNKSMLATVCKELAETYFREGQHEEAINEYLLEARLQKEMGKRINYGIANRMVGEVYSLMGEFEKALKYQEIHLVLAHKESNKLEEQRALATIGRTYLMKALSDTIVDHQSLKMANKSFMKSLLICESLKQISKLEQMDMRARLLLNLGVVQENQGNFEKGIEYIHKAIQICKTHDIYDQLHQGYQSLGLLYSRKEDLGNSIANFNLAFETASRLSDKVPLMCVTLLAKAEVLFKLAEFQSAKNVLMKAYKLKSPNKEEREGIEHSLKVCAAMCYAEDSLLAASEDDYKLKKKLYEKMGDGACELKIFSKATDYYKKMLECAISNGDTDKELIPCYVSLAQTYKDNNQFNLALEYFQKDFEISKKDPRDGYKTLLNIAEVNELAKEPYESVLANYKNARSHARTSGDVRIEGKVLSRMIFFCRKNDKHVEAQDLENELHEMNYMSDSETDESEGIVQIGDDIDLDDITDLSDQSEQEEVKRPRTVHRRSGFVVKKNIKGESQLHSACIAGNLTLVRRYLDQGHPVSIRDNCGWMPIHEACICGHKEIVELLIERGANINDRGGTLCNGITPLYDAASNGHLEIVALLLEHGASSISQTDVGETPLNVLKVWREGVELNKSEQIFYETIVSKMEEALEKAGRLNANKKSSSSKLTQKKTPVKTTPVKTTPVKTTPVKCTETLRYKIDFGSDEESTPLKTSIPLCMESSSSDSESTAQKEYKNVMKTLRKRLPGEVKQRQIVKPSALVYQNEIENDWLEDDLKVVQATKKRKSDNIIRNSLLNSSNTRITSNKKTKTCPDVLCFTEKENMAIEEILSSDTSNDGSVISNSSSERYKRKSQTTLMDSGFTKQHSDCPINTSFVSRRINRSVQRQPRISSFVQINEPDSTTNIENKPPVSSSSSSSFNLSMLAISVRIENKLWRVPVPVNDIDKLTIGWLAKEAAKRYCNKEGIMPTLQLETKDKAILMENDPLCMVFLSPTQPEEVQSVVVSWNSPLLLEKYVEACQQLELNINQYDKRLRKHLEEIQGLSYLNFHDFLLDNLEIVPLCRALYRQNYIQHLDLYGNNIGNKGLEELSKVLPTLDQLRVLNLGLNSIDEAGIIHLCRIFKNSDRPILEHLINLNLNYNYLSNECLTYIETILSHVKLRVLILSNNSFVENPFEISINTGIQLRLDYLEELDLSNNKLNEMGLIKFMSFLNFNCVTQLNIGMNSVIRSGLVRELALNLQLSSNINLTSLILSSCQAADDEVLQVLRTMGTKELKFLDLSYNENLTFVTLQHLFEMKSTPTHIKLISCLNILKGFNEIMLTFKCLNNLKYLFIVIDEDFEKKVVDSITSVWRKRWYDNAIVNIVENTMLLSVKDASTRSEEEMESDKCWLHLERNSKERAKITQMKIMKGFDELRIKAESIE